MELAGNPGQDGPSIANFLPVLSMAIGSGRMQLKIRPRCQSENGVGMPAPSFRILIFH